MFPRPQLLRRTQCCSSPVISNSVPPAVKNTLIRILVPSASTVKNSVLLYFSPVYFKQRFPQLLRTALFLVPSAFRIKSALCSEQLSITNSVPPAVKNSLFFLFPRPQLLRRTQCCFSPVISNSVPPAVKNTLIRILVPSASTVENTVLLLFGT